MARITALLLCTVLAGGCTTSRGLRPAAAPDPAAARGAATQALLVEYVQGLPPGTRVRVERTSGAAMTGTLLKVTDQYLAVQRHTRIPEPPEQIALDDILRVTPDSRNGVAQAIGIGAAAGASAALAVFFVLIAIYAN